MTRPGPGTVRVGISGWRYAGWRGIWYPEGLPQRAELAHAGAAFPTIEINGTFYSLQRPESFARWAAQVPAGFVFAVKGGRFVTHFKKLKGVRTPLANFFASGVLRLQAALGPFLWQLPPQLPFDAGRIGDFLEMLPPDTDAARVLAAEHDHRLEGRAWFEPGPRRPLRHALEVRHESYAAPELAALLRRNDVALVQADTAGRWPYLDEQTASFTYVRLHGATELYSSGYTDAELDWWAERVRAWAAGGRDAYVYFDNDAKVQAPFDAQRLGERLRDLAPRTAAGEG